MAKDTIKQAERRQMMLNEPVSRVIFKMAVPTAIKGEQLLHHIVKQTGAVGVGGGVIDLFSIAAADYKARTFKLLKMV